MITGIGIDIIELSRIQKAIKRNKRFVDRILTNEEKQHYETLTKERRKIEFIAGRFAAKEAFAKATGKGIGKLSFKHIEILPNKLGAPEITVQGFNKKTFLSISHSQDYAVAQVVITK